MKVSCSVEENFICSTTVEVCGSAFRESCSTTIGLTVCSVAGCSGLGGVGVTGVWTNDAEILLKIFVWMPQRPCSSLESSSSIITLREEVGMTDCIGTAGCTDLGGYTGV